MSGLNIIHTGKDHVPNRWKENSTDGASLQVMESDTNRMRPEKPWVFSNLKDHTGLDTIIEFIEHAGVLNPA